MSAAVEYGVARTGITAVRTLDHDVIGQAHHPRGAAGYVTAWEMAHRPSLLGVPVGRRIALRRSEEFTCGSQADH